MIKVLWFCNTPANADGYFDAELRNTGGWLKALDQALQNHVELHIAFYMQYDKSFKFKESYYYPIKTNQSLLRKVFDRFFSYVSYKEDLRKYLDIIDTVKPDIIHIHGTEAPFTCIIPQVKIPMVVSIQGITTVVLHKYFSGFEKRYLKLINRKTLSLKDVFFPETFATDYRWYVKIQKLEEKNLKLVHNIIGKTDWDKRITRILAPGSDYFHEDRVLRDSFYHREWMPHFGDKIYIHTTNSNNYYKGFETMCQALTELVNIGVNCEWRVAGIGSDDTIVKVARKKLKNKYPKKGLVLMGKIDEDALIENLLKSDIFVMTSHIENNANSLSEAMILGIPCISTFVGGTGSLIKDGEEGILIQSGDPWGMAGAILELVNDKEKAAKLGNNARKTALVRHDKDKIIKDLLITYDKVINKTTT